MNLVVISDPQFLPGEAEALVMLFEKGLKRLHLRKPQATSEELKIFLQSLPLQYHSRILIHDHLDLIFTTKLGGVHFGSRNRNKYDQFRSFCGLKSWATHHLDELLVLPKEVDHAFLSPVFPSISKKGYIGNLDMKAVTEYLQTTEDKRTFEVTAMGGITPERLSQVREWGFDGAAVLGYLWENFKNQQSLKGLEKRFLKLKALCA